MAKYVALKRRLDEEHVLEQLSGTFQSLRDGLPELVKNSKDQYGRLGVTEKDKRQIVIVFSTSHKHIGVLDFAGAAPEDFERWMTWSDRKAGRSDLAEDIEAGHGHGGKAFMVRGCRKEAYMSGHRNGERTQIGFNNAEPDKAFTPLCHLDDGDREIRGLADADPVSTLDGLLSHLGLHVRDLPQGARQVLGERQAYTLVTLLDVNELVTSRNRRSVIDAALGELRAHPQAALTLETCTVWVMDGKSSMGRGQISPEAPAPKEGFEKPWEFPVPTELPDPETGDIVAVPVGQTGQSKLEIHSSEMRLRMSSRMALNVVRVRNKRNVLANWSVADLSPSSQSAYLYGQLICSDLDASLGAGTDRHSLANVPLIRALRAWTAERLQEIVEQIARAEATRGSEPDRQNAGSALAQLRALMRDFLRPVGGTAAGSTTDTPTSNGSPVGHRVDIIELEAGRESAEVPVGCTVPLSYACYERDGDSRLPVRGAKVSMRCEPQSAASWHEGIGLRLEQPGQIAVWFETADGRIRSADLVVTAWPVVAVDLKPPTAPVKQGERLDLAPLGRTANGIALRGLWYETSLTEAERGRISRTGIFTAGGVPGMLTVKVRYGSAPTNEASVQIIVGNERVEPKQPPATTKTGEPDIPYILLCGDTAPGREDLPVDQRTQTADDTLPTIIDFDPIWRIPPEIIWINHMSKEAQKVRSGRGPTKLIGLKTQTFYDFLALKSYEVLRRLRVKQEMGDAERLTYPEFSDRLARSEMETAPFIDVGFELVKELLSGREQEN